VLRLLDFQSYASLAFGILGETLDIREEPWLDLKIQVFEGLFFFPVRELKRFTPGVK